MSKFNREKIKEKKGARAMQFSGELIVGLTILGVFTVALLTFSWWYLGQIDKMEQAAEDYLFSEIEALTKRFRNRAKNL